MSLHLSVDGSSKFFSLGLYEDSEMKASYRIRLQNNLSALMVPAIDSILKTSGNSLKDLDFISVSNGPGIFTGIRVSLSTIKGLIITLNTPVVPVNNLEASAHSAFKKSRHELILSLYDAKRDEVYASLLDFSRDPDDPDTLITPELIHIRDIPEKVKPYKNIAVTGSGALTHRNFLKEHINDYKFSESDDFLENSIAETGLRRYKKSLFIRNLTDLEALYLRKSDAETALLKKISENKT